MFYTKIPKTGNPSPDFQNFANPQIKILCCHYWVIDAWKHSNLSFPYWRLYWNNLPGAKISYKSEVYELTSEDIILIPPYTSFSTYYDPKQLAKPDSDFFIGIPENLYNGTADKKLKHLFIHFTLSVPFDTIEPQIFKFKLKEPIKELISNLTANLHSDIKYFDHNLSLSICSLITNLLRQIPENKWHSLTANSNINKILRHIDKNLSSDLSNKKLSSLLNMSPNSFLRLFTKEIKISPQQYILKKKIEKACVILQYTKYSIEDIAEQTGFSDRFYFSRIFKKITGISPAAYRKSEKF